MPRSRLAAVPIALALLSVAACGGGYARGPVTTPAPRGALECVLRAAAEQGYQPVAGGISDGFIRFEQRYWTGILVPKEHIREVTVTVASGQMRITASADRQAQSDIRSFAAACGTAV